MSLVLLDRSYYFLDRLPTHTHTHRHRHTDIADKLDKQHHNHSIDHFNEMEGKEKIPSQHQCETDIPAHTKAPFIVDR